jgi:hypothetical protein
VVGEGKGGAGGGGAGGGGAGGGGREKQWRGGEIEATEGGEGRERQWWDRGSEAGGERELPEGEGRSCRALLRKTIAGWP